MTNSFGLESAYHVTRMRASDWKQVQNIMECNKRCHWSSPTIENVMNNDPLIRDLVTLNKSVKNYLPRCLYHLLYAYQAFTF